MRLIDADALMERIKTYCDGCNSYGGVMCRACGYGDAIDAIEDATTIDAVPAVHGLWIKYDLDIPVQPWHCSNCGWFTYDIHQYVVREFHHCPYCGDRMDLK